MRYTLHGLQATSCKTERGKKTGERKTFILQIVELSRHVGKETAN